VPRYEDMEWRCLKFPKEEFEKLQVFDRAARTREVIDHEELFILLQDQLPKEMVYERDC
jgi:phosphoenolpyruvate carboxykinase (GTP)